MDRQRVTPDWKATKESVRETLREVLQTMRDESEAGVGADVICLNALDTLQQYLRFMGQDLGI